MQCRYWFSDVFKTAASMLVMVLAGPAFAAEIPSSPKADGNLYVDYQRGDSAVIKEIFQDQPDKIRMGNYLRFSYGIKRRGNEQAGPGAIVIKTTRVYANGHNATKGDANTTTLYRNVFPDRAEKCCDRHSTRDIYRGYHSGTVGSVLLRNNFHASVGGARTDAEARKGVFLFSGENVENPRTELLGVQLIYYQGVPPSGVWIPFTVSAAVELSQIRISIVDLGVDGDLLERKWTLLKE